MVPNKEKRRQLAELASRRKVIPALTDAGTSGPADAPLAATSAPSPSSPPPANQRQKEVVEATASKDEETCSGFVFKRKRPAKVEAPSFRENPSSTSSPCDIMVLEGGGRAPLEVIAAYLLLLTCLSSSNRPFNVSKTGK